MSWTGKLEGFVVNVRYSSGTCSYILDIVSREFVLLDLELLDAARHKESLRDIHRDYPIVWSLVDPFSTVRSSEKLMPSHSKAWWLGLHPNLGISTGSQLGPWDWGVLHVGSPLDGWIHWKSLKKNGWFGGTPIGNLHIAIYIYIILYLYGLWIRLEKPPQISAQRMLERHPKHRPFPCATLGLADTIYLSRASTWWLFASRSRLHPPSPASFARASWEMHNPGETNIWNRLMASTHSNSLRLWSSKLYTCI